MTQGHYNALFFIIIRSVFLSKGRYLFQSYVRTRKCHIYGPILGHQKRRMSKNLELLSKIQTLLEYENRVNVLVKGSEI